MWTINAICHEHYRDILGLDNLRIIVDACRLAGIERLTPDNIDFDDMDVWRSIRDDTTAIFQWESNSAQSYIRQFMSDSTLKTVQEKIPNFSMIKWLSFGNGLIRPACASFRDDVAKAKFHVNGFKELDEFLAPEAGRIAMQETIMQLMVRFCGYSNAESDTVRRAIAKKKGTETLLPEIRRRFIEYSSTHYDVTAEKCEEIVDPLIQIILDASSYAFSWNHSQPYSAIGYICGYLRYHYPLEFLTAALNTVSDNLEKTAELTRYGRSVGIQVTPPKFGISGGDYAFDRERRIIAKGISAIKHIGKRLGNQIHSLAASRDFDSFVDLLTALFEKTDIDSQQLSILIGLDFFSDFGNQRELERIVSFWEFFKRGAAKKIKKEKIAGSMLEDIVARYSTDLKKDGTRSETYTLMDIPAILKACEARVKQLGLTDHSLYRKIRSFNEAMGYNGFVTGKSEDRPILYIREVVPVKRKKDGKVFGQNVFTQSIGSGIEAKFTVFNETYDRNPVFAGDVIRCLGFTRDQMGYFTLKYYTKIIDDEQ